MTGKLYVIGVGPGDPELMTLKAVRILKQAPCVFVPKGREACRLGKMSYLAQRNSKNVGL